MTKTNSHTERLVKVNAWVDTGIASIVEAMNEFSEVETISSCEGDGHTFFLVRGGNQKLFEFMDSIGTELASTIEACCEFKLCLEWPGGHGAFGAIYVESAAIGTVSSALTAISRRRKQA